MGRYSVGVAGSRSSWSQAHVRRLFWRAGFGATPKEAATWAARGQAATIAWLLDGGSSKLVGPAPNLKGAKLDPVNEWGHDHLWWLDRMVRSQRPLEEKLTLFWHDHFATTEQDRPLMLRQNSAIRNRALGPFPDLLKSVATDQAMQLFLSLVDNDKDSPNENFARELMELFTLGGGYTERDVREAARALTGWRAKWSKRGFGGTYFDPERHDTGVKRILGKKGRYDWKDVLSIVTTHPRHAPYLVGKLWSFFVARPPSKATVKRLSRTYTSSGLRIKPVVASILADKALYADLDAPDMVKCPVVYIAGALRTTGHGIDREDWTWLCDSMGQLLFHPPSVAGWDWGPAWMSSNTMRTRFMAGNYLTEIPGLAVKDGTGKPELSADEALEQALAATGRPWISGSTRAELLAMARNYFDDMTKPWQQGEPKQERAEMLQRMLRHLLLTGPDAHLH
jgi:uncharacterized protein (DUF1800 family)